jgi:predicted Zn-dependent peptidase
MSPFSVLLTFVTVAGIATAQSAPDKAADQKSAELAPIVIGEHHFERRLLANGVRAVAVQDDGADMSIFIAVAAGNRNETAETTGLAHLTEHALFTGTPTTGVDQHEKTVVKWGGESNAFTRDDYTMYYDHSFPVEHLGTVLMMEADRLSSLSFEEAAVLHERHRLEVEEKHSYRTADGRAEQLENAFFTSHPYRHGLRTEAGHTKGPELSVAQIKEFYNTHYQPDRFAVVVVGPVDPQVALNSIEAAFGSLQGSAGMAQVTKEVVATEIRMKRIASQLPRDRFLRCWLTPAMNHPDQAALNILASMLGREQLPGGEVLTVSVGGRLDADIFKIGWSGSEQTAKEVATLMASYRDGSVFKDKANVDILTEVKDLMVASHVKAPLRARPYFSLAGTLAWHEVFGMSDSLANWGDAVAAVSAADLQRVAKHWLNPDHASLIIFEGTGEELAPLPDDVDGLYEAAAQASETGDYDRAIRAFTIMLGTKPNRMNTVIYYYERGALYLEMNDFDSAIADFEAALAVVDYPAVRDALEEAHARKARAMRGEFETPEED